MLTQRHCWMYHHALSNWLGVQWGYQAVANTGRFPVYFVLCRRYKWCMTNGKSRKGPSTVWVHLWLVSLESSHLAEDNSSLSSNFATWSCRSGVNIDILRRQVPLRINDPAATYRLPEWNWHLPNAIGCETEIKIHKKESREESTEEG